MDSCGAGKIRCRKWWPDGNVRAVVQLVHGIAEHVERYDQFASFLTDNGFLVVAEDHMGHGRSIGSDQPKGYFYGGWFQAVDDTYQLLTMIKESMPGVPYIIFGHSMGSFMARTLIEKYPDCGINACVLCGTGWMPESVLSIGKLTAKLICKVKGETAPSSFMQKMMFGAYNSRIENARTQYDWLTRDNKIVDAYQSDELCGFDVTGGLSRDLLTGMKFIQKTENLKKMNKQLPVLFIAGGDDPVGNYGKGVIKTADMFEKNGMRNICVKLYPLCRHEILNEINAQEVYCDIIHWIDNMI